MGAPAASKISPAGNRTRVTRVTGGYTNLYTTEDVQKMSQTAGFEPAHAEHTRLAGEPRNHLGTSAWSSRGRVAQSVERRSDKAKVLGSSPSMTMTSPFYTVTGWCSAQPSQEEYQRS